MASIVKKMNDLYTVQLECWFTLSQGHATRQVLAEESDGWVNDMLD